jgi:hypothetical protein
MPYAEHLAEARRLAKECIADAKTQGISKKELDEDLLKDLVSELKDRLDTRDDEEVKRMAKNDFDTGRREYKIEGAKQKYGRPHDRCGHDTLHRSKHAQSTPIDSQPLVRTGLAFFSQQSPPSLCCCDLARTPVPTRCDVQNELSRYPNLRGIARRRASRAGKGHAQQ